VVSQNLKSKCQTDGTNKVADIARPSAAGYDQADNWEAIEENHMVKKDGFIDPLL
jgi:hypothetical protein